MLTMFFILFLSCLCLLKIVVQGFFLIHKLQQMGYENQKFLKWLEGNQYRKVLVWNLFELFIPLFVILLFYFCKDIDLRLYKAITSIMMCGVFIWKITHPFFAGWIGKKANHKKPLVYTPRVKRLVFTLIFLIVISLFLMFCFVVYPIEQFSLSSWGFFKYNAFILLFSVITPIFILLSNWINLPLEKLIHLVYFFKAKWKRKKANVCSIGVTGSFGKTSTKFFLTEILSAKYKTLTTPSSFNTPMGLSKVINSNELSNFEYFVAEMGADHVGDIQKLCSLVSPKIGIITAVGIQHLETFGIPENILKTKLELFDAIPSDGFGAYNYDSEMLREGIKSHHYSFPIYSYSILPENRDKVDLFADHIRHTKDGLNFEAIFQNGEVLSIVTELLGRHNVLDLLGAIIVAKKLGISSKEIERKIKSIEAVEHRLKKIDPKTGILILDDAFNSNYNGAIEAVNVLNEIEGNKKIVVTPGFVELGKEEERLNKMFGEYMAAKVDYVILVGATKTFSIREGLLNGGFSYNCIIPVNSLSEAQKILTGLLMPGDVVLFENDLPDIYSE